MSVASGAALPTPTGEPRRYVQVGRAFLHPALDYLLIGGGLSLVLGFALPREGGLYPEAGYTLFVASCVLLFNSAHFAASTVRLYTKPGAFREWPFLTMVFPLATLAVLTFAIVYSASVGRHLFALYLTWSPYHYAAQAFGLAAMYCYRSGCSLDGVDRHLLWSACMLPFAYSFTIGVDAGLGWFVPADFFPRHPTLAQARMGLAHAMVALALLVPAVLVLRLGRRGQAFPLISLLLMIANGIWWVVFSYLNAFVWATVFHGIQYLAIVTIFHVRDQTARPGNQRGALYHTLWFYGVCVALGYALFDVWPYAYVLAGFELSESMLLVAAVINIHHFIVDRFIWRLRKDPNYRIVVGAGAGSSAR